MTDQNDFIDPDPVIIDAHGDGSDEPVFTTQPGLEQSEENTLAMFAHLGIFLNLFTVVLGLLPPLIIYFAYKDRSRYVAYQAMQALVFQGVFFFGAAILAGIAWALSAALTLVSCVPGAKFGTRNKKNERFINRPFCFKYKV